MKDSDS